MSDEDPEEEAYRERMAAFEARLPLEAFEPIAVGLQKSTDPQSLNALRGWLLEDFYLFCSGRTENPRTRIKRKRDMTKRSKAAAALLASIKGGSFHHRLPDVFDEPFWMRFTAVLERWANPASIRPRGRRRPLDPFRKDLVPSLIWVYEHITRERAGKPYWLPDSGVYGGKFYRFACAVRHCLHDCVPEVRTGLPSSDGALAQELQDHWPEPI
jgi:hypothetical protein